MPVPTGAEDPKDREVPQKRKPQDARPRGRRDDELSPETPEADAAEQRADLLPDDDEPEQSPGPGADGEADEADRAEQARPAGRPEDDDYR